MVGENTEVATFDLQGGDASFDYPKDWDVVYQGNSIGDSVLYTFLDDPSVDSGDYEAAVYLYPIGNSIDSAIQMFHDGLNSYWQCQERTVTDEMINQYGRIYKKVTYIGATGSGLNSWFVKNKHNFIVRGGSDSPQYYWVGDLVANSVR